MGQATPALSPASPSLGIVFVALFPFALGYLLSYLYRAVNAIVARQPAIVWLGYTVHGGEASGTEASLAMLYQLAAGQEEVLRALDRLPESFRGAVVLRDMQDFSYEEIAGILQVPIGTVMSRIHRGRALLRGMLQGVGEARG